MNYPKKNMLLKKNIIFLYFAIIILFFPSCEKLKFERVMDAITDSINVTGTTVIAHGTVVDLGAKDIIRHGHCWSKNPNPSIEDFSSDLGVIQGEGDFYSILNNLTPGVTQYVRSYLYNGEKYSYGEIVPFQISAEDIKINSFVIEKIDYSSIKLSSTVTGIGSVLFSNHGHCWSQTESPTIDNNKTSFGMLDSNASFESNITDLNLGKYFIRGYLESEGGIIYSNTLIFESSISVKTDEITVNTDNSIIAYATINSLGVKPIINHGHCWSTISSSPDLNFSSEHNSLGNNTKLGSYSSKIKNLISGRVYYVRAYVTDGSKVYYGEIKNFKAN